ncbi:MAG TPA: DNA mismatch repair protein MutS [Terriglobales bacterium]
MNSGEAQTPLMRQYQQAKRQNPDALLLFRLGDFYELFFEDAVTAARVLQITLTARNKEKGTPIPMCGVPHHAAENYIAKLIAQGFKVALCEQMEDPKVAKTLVRREVTRVLTPGTAAFSPATGENTYLAALARSPQAIGLALLDVSTGEFRATEIDAAAGQDAEARVDEELARWRPREILVAAGQGISLPGATVTSIEPWAMAPEFAHGVLAQQFGVLSLDGFGLSGHPWAQAAAGAVVHYVKETQRSQLAHIDRLGYFERGDGLVLDAPTVRNLELVEPIFSGDGDATLRAVMDQTVTPMGKRLLRQWITRPSGSHDEILARHDAVEYLLTNWQARHRVREVAAGIQDLERLLSRLALSTAGPRDLLALRSSLDQIPLLLDAATAALPARLEELGCKLDPLDELRASLAAHIVDDPPALVADGGFIRLGVSAALDELRALSGNAKGAIASIESRERERTSIGSLKVRFNNIFGYYIEVSRANLRSVPADYERKQTLVNAERFTTPELKELEVKILGADEKSRALELELFAQLRARVTASAAAIRNNAQCVAELDVLANFAHIAGEHQFCRPIMAAGPVEIVAGRHPVVERLGADDARFVPNDLFLDRDTQRILLITGPNMGGKSTYLRQAALIAILAQMGSFVPARAARLPVFDRIFTRIGASDNLARGRSTFMVEMTEAAVILNQATDRSLVILDEIGRGTATYDGLSLAWAMIEYLHATNASKTLFATHYHELTELAAHLDAVKNVHVAVKETPDGIAFLRRVETGEASRSYGIEVARLAGLPRAVLERAREVLALHEQAELRTSRELEAAAGSAPPEMQLTLFTPLSQQIVDQLAAADLNRLSPIQALNLLAALQRQLNGN